MSDNGILFDSRYELLFLKKGIEEGLITGSTDIRKQILSLAKNRLEPYKEKTMLQMLLLYDRCFCLKTKDFEELNLTRVIDRDDLISYIPIGSARETFPTADILALKDILLSQVDFQG
ncbi:hypothetical protein MUP77_05485, partial [Candidatus Bathyarchaeota archaeon]|nr:hypothetical protein [Candidatus Bathyarchaeota archaeon]